MPDSGDENMVHGDRAVGAGEDAVWSGLRTFTPSERHLDKHRIITVSRRDPASNAIDLLRTRILNAMEERGWMHLGITSPTRNCGKTFISSNLGFSLAREKHMRTILFDMDLRNPGLTRALGVPDAGPLVEALNDERPIGDQMVRLFDNLALVPNETATNTAAEVLKSSVTAGVLARAFARMRPDMVVYDLPPALICDDVLAFKHRLDALLLVIHGRHSTPQEVRDFEALFDGEIPILATVLNEAEDAKASHYMEN